jgi:hypothetical protein
MRGAGVLGGRRMATTCRERGGKRRESLVDDAHGLQLLGPSIRQEYCDL